ncbi:tetratricopeptide repeat protein [candidate division WOR-3 bacterium]|nr:tetratricopeptide repeat protein [candidate division WOR-3 bacterium]
MHKRINLPIKVFVDRLKEINQLKELLMNDTQGERIIIVRGNVGAGKTRFVQEVLKTVEWRDMIWGDCSYLADYIAYYIVRELVKFHIQAQGPGILKGIAPSYKRIIGKLVPEAMDEDAEQVRDSAILDDKFAFNEGIKQVLERGARAKIIVVDNSQWIDQSSADLLRFLIKAEKKQRISFVFLYRSDEETEVLKTFLSAVRKNDNVTEISIEPFSQNEVRAILVSIIGEEPEEHFMRYVLQWSGGNPFYIEEITSTLVLDGHLVLDRGHWSFHEPKTGTVPRTITEIATAKYLSLSSDAQRVLDVASVIGWFDVQILEDLVGLKSVRIVELIEEIDKVGMIRYTEERIEFSDEITRNAVYAQVAQKADVKSIHRNVGNLVKQQSRANERPVVQELAYHYYHGADPDKGVRFCIRAGDNAREGYAHKEAIRYYTWALEMLTEGDKREKIEFMIECLRKRIAVFGILGEHEHALNDIRKAIMLVQKIHDANCEMEMLYDLAHTLFQLSKPHDASREVERLIALAEQRSDHMWRARGIMLTATIQMHFANYAPALELYKEALAYFERVNDQKNMSTINMHMSVIYRNLGKFDQAHKMLERAQSYAEHTGDKRAVASCLIVTGNLHSIVGQYDQALRSYEEAYRVHRDVGYKQGAAIACASISNAYVAQGQYRKGLQYMQDAMGMMRGIDDHMTEAGDFANIGGIYTWLGEYPKAINAFENGLRIAREIEASALEVYILDHLGSVYYYLGNFPYADSLHKEASVLIKQRHLEVGAFHNLLFRGRLYLAEKKLPEAKTFIENANETARKLGSKTMTIDALFLLCEYNLEQGDKTLFIQHMKKVSDYETGPLVKSTSGYQDFLFGRFHILDHDFPTAGKVLRSALQVFEGLEEQYNIGQVYAYLGIMERLRGQEADGRAYLITARGIFEAIGAKAWKQRIDGILNAEPSSDA